MSAKASKSKRAKGRIAPKSTPRKTTKTNNNMKKKVVKKSSSKSSRKTSTKTAPKIAKKKVAKKTSSRVTKKKAVKKAVKKATTRKVAGKISSKTAPRKVAKKAVKKKVAKNKPGVAGGKKVKARKKMSRRALAPFRARLLEKQRELMINYASMKGSTTDSAEDGTEDYIDYAVSSYAKEFMLSLTEMDRKQLKLVDEALVRIEKSEYGSCQQCGHEIPEMRLEVAPWARHCVKCQELEDKGMLPQDYFSRGQEELEEEEDLSGEDETGQEVEDGESTQNANDLDEED